MRVTQSRLFPFFLFFLIFGKYTKRNRLLLLVEVIIIFLPTPVMSMAVENSIHLTYKVIRCIHSSLRVCVCVCCKFAFIISLGCNWELQEISPALRRVVYCFAHWATFDDMSCVTPVTNVCVFCSFFFLLVAPSLIVSYLIIGRVSTSSKFLFGSQPYQKSPTTQPFFFSFFFISI